MEGTPDALGPKIKDYVKRIHGRYALLGHFFCFLFDVSGTVRRPAYQQVGSHSIYADVSATHDVPVQALQKGGEYKYAKLTL